MNRFKWDQEAGTEPTIAQLKSMLTDVFTVMREQTDCNGEPFADGNPELFAEVSEFLGFVDACHFVSGEVTFRGGNK